MTRLALVVRAALTIAAVTLGGHLVPGMPGVLSVPAQAEATHAPLEGFGAVTKGGAGQPECLVTSLADAGPGTLRECLLHGNRYVRFAVAGEIHLVRRLYVMGGFVTIDGFSAPAPGITLKGHSLLLWRQHSTYTNDAHDVIVRGIRIRDAALSDGSADCIGIHGTVYNVVIDHVSLANCGDGGIDVTGGARNITIQWSIISDDKAHLLGTTSGGALAERISFHHNIVAAGVDRMPLVRPSGNIATDTLADIRQNIFEGWLRANGTRVEDGGWANLVGNTYIPRSESTWDQRVNSVRFGPATRVYTARNVELGPAPAPDYNAYGNEDVPLPAPAITAMPVACVIARAGVHPRDAIDLALLDRVDRVGGGCSIAPAPVPPDPVVTSRPDLVPRTVSAPSTLTVGALVSVTVTVANAGTATASGTTTRLYLSVDRVVGAGDTAVGSTTVPSLSPGQTYSGAVRLTMPVGIAAGAYTLLARVDDGGAIAEASESNNTLAIPLQVAAAARPDLVARSLAAPTSVTAGQTVSMTTTIANAGSGVAAASTARLYLSTDRTVGAGDTALGPVAVPSLAAGGTHTATVRATLPATAAVGTYMLLLRADDGGVVAESNETNNTFAVQLVATAPTPTSPQPGPFTAKLIEAEWMAVASGMTVGADPRALGGRYISPTAGTSTTAPVREASVTVSVPAAGTYYLWARMYAPSTASDALYVGIDGSWDRAFTSATGAYQWVRIETTSASRAYGFQLDAGSHTIHVGRGEVHARLDALYLTSSPTDVPALAPGIAAFVPVLVQAEAMGRASGITVGADPRALGGGYISPTAGTSSTAPVREASLTVGVPASGTYYLWARMYAPSTAADALYFGIDASWDRAFTSTTGTYQWVRIETANGSRVYGFQLGAGWHTIQVGRGERDARLDAVYLTDSPTDVPTLAP